ncbi:uncharacterized protein B0T15DRAFT_23441 [Chaetomium strumarium]|uniref:Uncharacterized protein n=1 Tax=Chaetomium strumarium TaxID=1170767 RepID=A0AAJ0M5Q7_9PEZI|nr:hypothetical protein B0T15DRAFT_23441 [Chaetomium strumarium]
MAHLANQGHPAAWALAPLAGLQRWILFAFFCADWMPTHDDEGKDKLGEDTSVSVILGFWKAKRSERGLPPFLLLPTQHCVLVYCVGSRVRAGISIPTRFRYPLGPWLCFVTGEAILFFSRGGALLLCTVIIAFTDIYYVDNVLCVVVNVRYSTQLPPLFPFFRRLSPPLWLNVMSSFRFS